MGAHGYTYAGIPQNQAGTGQPKGCYVITISNRDVVYFNPHASGATHHGAAPICRKDGYTVMSTQTNVCSHGSQTIQDATSCRNGAQWKGYRFSGTLSTSAFPKGCFVWMAFNVAY